MQTWPSTLPEWQQPYSDQQTDQFISFSTDTGPGKQRKRYTGEPRQVSVGLTVNGTQRQTLDDLYSGGDFEHNDPKDDTLQQFRFQQAPQYKLIAGGATPADRVYKTELKLFRLP